MSRIMSAIRSILAQLGQLVWVCVDGMWKMFRKPTPLGDLAGVYVEEAASPQVSPETRANKAAIAGLECNRVQLAAKAMLKDETIPISALNPALMGDARTLAWLRSLTRVQLGIVSMADPKKIQAHLNGVRSLPMPLVEEFDRKPPATEKPKAANVNFDVLRQLRPQVRSGR